MKKFIILICCMLSCSFLVGAGPVAKGPVAFTPPEKIKVPFRFRQHMALKDAYNKKIQAITKTYQEAINSERKKYKEALELSKKDNLKVVADKKELELVKKEINRITIELNPGKSIAIEGIRDKSADFVINKVNTYTIKPTDEWIKIADLKKGDVVIMQFSGKMSKDVTQAPLTDHKSAGCKIPRIYEAHKVGLKVFECLVSLKGLSIQYIEKGDYYQYTLEIDGPFFVGYSFNAVQHGFDPVKNGSGKLNMKLKVIRR